MRNQALDPGLAAIGEVGLSGELRGVPQAQRRLAEASRLGLSTCVVPETVVDGLSAPPVMRLVPVRTVRQAFQAVIGASRAGRQEGATVELANSFDSE